MSNLNYKENVPFKNSLEDDLVQMLLPYVGERQQSECARECLHRIITERNEAYIALGKDNYERYQKEPVYIPEQLNAEPRNVNDITDKWIRAYAETRPTTGSEYQIP